MKTKQQTAERILELASLENASFSKIAPDDKYPTNEAEADAFIKARIKPYMNWFRLQAYILSDDQEKIDGFVHAKLNETLGK